MIQKGSKVKYVAGTDFGDGMNISLTKRGVIISQRKPNNQAQPLENGEIYTVREVATTLRGYKALYLEEITNGVNPKTGNEWAYAENKFDEVTENEEVEETPKTDLNGVPKWFGIPTERANELRDLIAPAFAQLAEDKVTSRIPYLQKVYDTTEDQKERDFLFYILGCLDEELGSHALRDQVPQGLEFLSSLLGTK